MSSASSLVFPLTVAIPAGSSSVSFLGMALNDMILFNTHSVTISGISSAVGLTVAPISVTIVDATADNPENLKITIGSIVIYESGRKGLSIRYTTPGITSVSDATLNLLVDIEKSNLYSSTYYDIPPSVTISAGQQEEIVEVSASSSDARPVFIIIKGTATDLRFNVSSGKLTVLDKKFDIPPVVSNNNDRHNPCLWIGEIHRYPINRVSIVNRWGILVYQIDNYDNNGERRFCGYSNVRSGDQLADGTYYYVIDFKEAEKFDAAKSELEEGTYYGFFELRHCLGLRSSLICSKNVCVLS